MFSSRLRWDAPRNELAEKLHARRASGRPFLDLTESNPTRAGLSYPEEEILAALGDSRGLRYDPDPRGAAEAREAVGRAYAARGVAVGPDQVLLTAGTSEAYALLFKLLCDPGDEVIVPCPSYPLFDTLAAVESVRPVPCPLLREAGWALDMELIASRCGARTRALVVVHPNNPTGSFLKRRQSEALANLCAERGIALISDEVFADYAFAPDSNRMVSLADLREAPTFVLGGLSKGSGFPQMKLGWIVLAGPPDHIEEAGRRLELLADSYLTVAGPVQAAAGRLLALGGKVREGIRRRLAANLDALRATLSAQEAVRLLDVEGGWYATIRAPATRTDEEWALALLEQDGVLVQPGYFYDFSPGCFLIVSLLTPPGEFLEGIARLRDRLVRDLRAG